MLIQWTGWNRLAVVCDRIDNFPAVGIGTARAAQEVLARTGFSTVEVADEQIHQRIQEDGGVVQSRGALKLEDAALLSQFFVLDIDLVQRFKVVADKSDGNHQHPFAPGFPQLPDHRFRAGS